MREKSVYRDQCQHCAEMQKKLSDLEITCEQLESSNVAISKQLREMSEVRYTTRGGRLAWWVIPLVIFLVLSLIGCVDGVRIGYSSKNWLKFFFFLAGSLSNYLWLKRTAQGVEREKRLYGKRS